MVESQQTRESSSLAMPSGTLDAAMRVDPPHVHAGQAPASEAVAIDISDDSGAAQEAMAVVTLEQIRTQAAQLAGHLQRHQSVLDHRESELNARLAALESQLRAGRLWLTGRHEEIAARSADLDRRELELVRREEQLAAVSENLLEKPPAGDTFHGGLAELAARKAELDRREDELQAAAARLADRLAEADTVREANAALHTLEERRENLDRAEQMLAQAQAELERQRQLLSEERAEMTEQRELERRSLNAQRQAAKAEAEKTRRELARASDELVARQAALLRMRSEVERAQRETLEIRLATEELWARLCGTMAPAALTQSLAQIRLQLAEEGRLAREELAQQKAEAQALAARLAEQHDKLAHARQDLQAWHTQQQKQLEVRAGLLAVQQQHLETERGSFHAASADWQSERFRFQQEIRRLMRQSSSGAAAA